MRLGILAASAMFAVAGFSGANATTSTTIGFGSGGAGHTWTESGYLFEAIDRDNSGGNCPFGDPACMDLNNNSETVMTAVGGGKFSLLKFNFEFSGTGTGGVNEFDIFADGDSTTTLRFIEGTTVFDDGTSSGTLQKNVSYRTEWIFDPDLFTDVTSITFRHKSGGTTRIDDVMVSAIPLPLGAMLLASAFGLATALRRRRLGVG